MIAALSLFAATASAQDAGSCDNGTFRNVMDATLSKGDQQYMRSYRPGIKLYADSLESMLRTREGAGLLMREDSAKYMAAVKKLRGDWYYENSYYDEDSYAKAEACFLEALAIYAQFSSELKSLRQAPMIHRELAQLYYKQARYAEAQEQLEIAKAEYDRRFKDEGVLYTDDMSAEQYQDYFNIQTQLAICLARNGKAAEALQEIDGVLKEYETDGGESYYEALRKKAKIIMLAGGKGCEAEALPLYRKYFDWRKEDAMRTLATMTAEEREGYWMRMRPFVADCYQTEGADPAFLYDVTLFSKGLLLQVNRLSGHGTASTAALNSLRYTWRQIQRRLTEGSCAIEFVQYEKRGEQKMGAIVLRNTGSPQWVEMLSPDDFMSHQSNGRTNKERIYNTAGSTKNALYNDSAFYSQIWNGQLVKAIGKCKKVYFAPDGYLHQVAIEYMIPDELAKADFYRLTSTRRLMESGRVRTDAALIVGGVLYNAQTESEADGENDAVAYDYLTDKHATNFSYLQGSMAEADTIRSLRSAPRDTLLTGAAATEQAFRQLCGQYPIVSISTHGYFGAAEMPQGTDLKTAQADESLSQCVLALAGANTSLSDEAFDARCMDGIVSAHELSALDCTNVDLAVVSACQTALGYVTADGVYGIQRGLKNAGVGCLLVSLWNVDDEATCLLMSHFHKNLRAGMTAHQAFKAARASLLSGEAAATNKAAWEFDPATMAHRRTKAAETYEKPMYRNAFVLIDAIE